MSAPGTKPLSADEIARLCQMYLVGKSDAEIAARFGIRPKSVQRIALRRGWKRSAAPVNPKPKPVAGSYELEVAKRILRRKGRVVFDATVDRSGPRGFIKCDGHLFTADEIIHMASR